MTSSRLWAGAALLLPSLLFAGGGDAHSHGDTKASPVAASAQPLRVEAVSEFSSWRASWRVTSSSFTSTASPPTNRSPVPRSRWKAGP